jgi:hypothetical protein
MVVLTDYKSIRRIVYHGILNTISIDRANHRFINALVYLFVYQLDIYYIPSRLNFVPNAFSYLYTLRDDIVCEDDIEPVLDVL